MYRKSLKYDHVKAFPKLLYTHNTVSVTDIAIDFKAGKPSVIGYHGQFHSLLISSVGVHAEVLGKQHPYRALAHVHMWRKPITGST